MDETTGKLHFGDWLKRQIENLALQQKDFAAMAGVGFGALRLWISSAAPNIRGANLVKLARSLHISRDALERTLAEAHLSHGHSYVSETLSQFRIPLIDSPMRHILDGTRTGKNGYIAISIDPFSEGFRAVVLGGNVSVAQASKKKNVVNGISATVAVFDSSNTQDLSFDDWGEYIVWLKQNRKLPTRLRLRKLKRSDQVIAERPFAEKGKRRFKINAGDIASVGRLLAVVDYFLLGTRPESIEDH